MKRYQDLDLLHGNGKAIPHPKRPTSYTYRGAGGIQLSVDPMMLRDEREARKQAKAKEKSFVKKASIGVTIHAAIAAVLGFARSFGRGR